MHNNKPTKISFLNLFPFLLWLIIKRQNYIIHRVISAYILDLEVKIIAKDKGKNGKYNIPKEFYANVQYGNKIKTICSILNTECQNIL